MNKFYFVMAASALMFCACSDKENEPNPEEQGNGSMKEYTSEESKEYLSDTSTEFLNMFNPADQTDAINLAAYFSDEYGDFDMPEEFYFEDDQDANYSPSRFFRNLSRGVRGDVDALTRSTYTYTYNINFERCSGIYEPNSNRETWLKTGSSNDIIFRFTDANGASCELKASKSGDDSKIDFNYTDEDYYDTEKYYYYISIPHTIDVTLKQAGKVIFTGKVTSSVDVKGHTLSIESTTTCANISVAAKVNGTDTELNASSSASVNGNAVMNSSAKISGQHLCDKSYLEKMDDDDFGTILNSAVAKVDVLGKVQAYGNAEYYESFGDDLDFYIDSWDDFSESQAKSKIQNACDRLNSHVKAYIRYNNTATDQAKLSFVPLLDEWGSDNEYWDYRTSVNLVFPDGSSYNMESYFEKFTSVSNKWESLIDAYDRAWNRAVR